MTSQQRTQLRSREQAEFPAPDSTTAPLDENDGASPHFADLVAPLSPDQFFAEYWEKAPLVSRGRSPTRFTHLFATKDIDRLLTYTRPKPSRIEVVTDQGFVRDNYLNPDGTANTKLVMDCYLAGSTIIMAGLDDTWEPLFGFSRALEATLNHHAGMTAYLTPPSSGGVQPHFDSQENFLLQVEGSKQWKVYGPWRELPEVEGAWAAVSRDKIGEPILETTLNAGDVLYIPRGFVHEGRSNNEPSLHITVDLAVCTWQEFLTSALNALADRDARFRRSLPVGFLSSPAAREAATAQFAELVGQFRQNVRVEDAVTKYTEQLLVRRAALPDGQFSVLFATIEADTPLQKRRSGLTRVFTTGAVAGIQFSGNQVLGPAKILDALKYIDAHDVMTAAELPDSLKPGEKLVLARRLVRTGLLRSV